MRHINPNYITSLRFFIFAPLTCFLLMRGHLALALVAMGLGEFTDFLDGFIARRTGQVSNIGKIYDPMCDSVFHTIIWMSFLALGWVSVYLAILFFVRDSVVANIRICLAGNNIVLAARISGKIKAGAQGTAQITVVFLHIFLKGNVLEHSQFMIILLAALITVYSLYDYGRNFYQAVKVKGGVF